jgi:hypothetical protein
MLSGSAAGLELTIRAVTTRAVRVPMRFTLGTSAAVISEAPLILADVTTEEGIVGRSYLFAYGTSGARASPRISTRPSSSFAARRWHRGERLPSSQGGSRCSALPARCAWPSPRST